MLQLLAKTKSGGTSAKEFFAPAKSAWGRRIADNGSCIRCQDNTKVDTLGLLALDVEIKRA